MWPIKYVHRSILIITTVLKSSCKSSLLGALMYLVNGCSKATYDLHLFCAVYRHGIFPPIGGFPPIERSHSSFLRSVQIRWENYRVYLICERFSESNFANLPRSSISFLHGTFSNGVNLFCFGHHQSVHGLTESTTKGSNPIVTCKSAV